MNTTRPTRGAARARAIATLAGLALTSAALAGTPTIARWAAPLSGSFYDSVNWVDSIRPSRTIDALIDASGSPYTVTVPVPPPGAAPISRLTLDSDDATLLINNFSDPFGWFALNLDIRRGLVLADRGRILSGLKGSVQIGPDATLRVVEAGPANSPDAGVLALSGGIPKFSNRGLIELEANTVLFLGAGNNGDLATLYNASEGVIRLDRASELSAGNIVNDGLIELSGRPTSTDGSATTTVVTGGGPLRTNFTHNGTLRLNDAELLILGTVTSAGLMDVAADSSLFINSTNPLPSQTESLRFEPGAAFTGGGEIGIITQNGSGVIVAQNNLIIQGTFNGSVHNQGNTTLKGQGSAPFAGDLGSLTSSGALSIWLGLNGLTIENDLVALSGIDVILNSVASSFIKVDGDATVFGDVNFGQSAFADTTFFVNGDLTIDNSTRFSLVRTISVGGNIVAQALDTDAAITVDADANFDGNASARRLSVGGVTTVRGDLVASQGAVTLNDGSVIDGSVTANVLAIRGDVSVGTIVRPTAPAFTLNLAGNLTLTDDTQPLLLTRSTLNLAGEQGDAPSRITGDVILTAPINPFTPSFTTGVWLADDSSRSLAVEGQMSIEGRLAITFLGGASGAYLGQSFTLIHATEGLTGQFDPLSLPTLAGGLSLELVYESHALTLRVIPAPGPAALLALTSLAATRRRRA